MLYRLEVVGASRVPLSGALVVVANHESVLDPFVLGAALPRELRFLAKSELWRHRPVAGAMDLLGAIPVERGRGDAGALALARAALAEGLAVAVFPEGRVSPGGAWHRGAARLALATGAPVVPVRLVGTSRALSRRHVGLPRLRVVVGEPLQPTPGRPGALAARDLTDRIRATIEAL